MQHNLVNTLRRMTRIPLTPIITTGIRKDIPRPAEARCRDALPRLREPLQPVLRVLVPEVEGPVRAARAEGSVNGVEGDGVDAVDVCLAAVGGVGLPVALETEIVVFVLLLYVLDCTAAFYAADGEAAAVCEAGDCPRLPL